MNTVQLAPLNIGSNVFIKTTSKAECTGTYKGFLEEKHSICLDDAKWYGAGTDVAPSNYDSLILPLDSIAHIEGISKEAAVAPVSISDTDSSLVKVADIEMSETTSASTTALNGIAAQKVQLKSNIERTNSTRMQEFCKQLFSSCNFAHLLQMQANKNETKFCIKLPSYYAGLFRQPKWCFQTTQPLIAAAVAKEENQSTLAVVKPEITAAIDMALAKNLLNLQINAAKSGAPGDSGPQNPHRIDDTEYVNLNLCSKLSHLNLNENFGNKMGAALEAVEIDLSNLQSNNTFAQIKIGNLSFKTSTQIRNLLAQQSAPEN